MEAHPHYFYGNSPHRYGTSMDSPPPPYTGGVGDLSFEGVKFSVMGSGRKLIPCPHCRREVGAFDTLLLKSEGLKKGNTRNESIYVVNVLDRYNAIGNVDYHDGRPPLYTIPNSSHFGAEYCRHCNETDSISNKPLSCDSTRAETSSRGSSSDVEQFSNSLDDNSSLTNKYSQKGDQPDENTNDEGINRFHQNNKQPEDTTSRNGHTRRRSKSPKNPEDGTSNRQNNNNNNNSSNNNHNNNTDYPTESQPDDHHGDRCKTPEYSSTPYSNSHHRSKPSSHGVKMNSNLSYQRSPIYPVVAYQDEVFLNEDVGQILQKKMGGKYGEVLKSKEQNPYRVGQDIETLKTSITRLVEDTLQSWLSCYETKTKLVSSLKDPDKLLNKKGDIPPPLKLNSYDSGGLNVVCPKESQKEQHIYSKQTNGHYTPPMGETEIAPYCSHDSRDCSPQPRKVDQEGHHHHHPHRSCSREGQEAIQTPANDSGFFSPSPRILSDLGTWEQQSNDSKSFRHNPHDISSDAGSTDAKLDFDKSDESHDSDQCEMVHDSRNQKRTRIGIKSETPSVSSSKDTNHTDYNDQVNDDDYDPIDQVMSPRDNFAAKSKPLKKGKFRRSIDRNGNQKPDLELSHCSNEKRFRRINGDVIQPKTPSLKNSFNSFEKIDEPLIISQERPQTFGPPLPTRGTPSPVSPTTEWETNTTEQLDTNYNFNTSSSETSEATDSSITSIELRIADESYGTLDLVGSVAKRLDFDSCSGQSSPSVYENVTPASVDTPETADTKQWTENTDPRLAPPPPPPPPPDLPTTVENKTGCTSDQKGKKLRGALKLNKVSKKKQTRHVEINEQRTLDNNKVQSHEPARKAVPKEPPIEAVTTCKARALLQSFESSTKNIGTYTPTELEAVHTATTTTTTATTATANLLYTGGPFQADQNFRSWLADIVCNDFGQYIVSDWSNCCIQMFSTAGLPGDRVTFKSGPWGLALMDASVVACTIPHAKQVALLSHGSRLVVVGLMSTERRYWGIAVTRDQNLVCSCTQGIDLLSSTGRVLRNIQYNEVGLDFFVFPQYLTIGDNDVIYVSDSCGTYLIGLPKDGDFSFEFKPLIGTKFITPRAIEYGPDGYVYTADTDTNKIYRLTKDGNLDTELFTAADGIYGPLAITLRRNKMIVTQTDSRILILPL